MDPPLSLEGFCGPHENFVSVGSSYACVCQQEMTSEDTQADWSSVFIYRSSSESALLTQYERKEPINSDTQLDDIFTADQIRLVLFDERSKRAMGITFQGTFDYWSWFSRETLNTVYVWDLDPIDHFDSFKFHREPNGRGFDITVNQNDDDDCMSTIFLRMVCPGHAAFKVKKFNSEVLLS